MGAQVVSEYGPVYQYGHLSIENTELIEQLHLGDCQFGIQVASDGRVWVCVNGIAWIRFKPAVSQ